MNGLGGDNFWLIKPAGHLPIGIDACGAAAKGVNAAIYRAAGHTAIPSRGGQAALTVAGAVAGWQEAYALAKEWGGRLPLQRLLEEAIHYARDGFAVTDSQYSNTIKKCDELRSVPGFSNHFLLTMVLERRCRVRYFRIPRWQRLSSVWRTVAWRLFIGAILRIKLPTNYLKRAVR
ncbi:MAG: hypothetical protein Ct9H300mP13_1280 [Gammaproteobacteria bacterium]|nr:MAG: hypothetical protein Ct9H300mP13_1280 [Gammaproteobacteria bacterium]